MNARENCEINKNEPGYSSGEPHVVNICEGKSSTDKGKGSYGTRKNNVAGRYTVHLSPKYIEFVENLIGTIGVEEQTAVLENLKLRVDTVSAPGTHVLRARIMEGRFCAHEMVEEVLTVIEGEFLLFVPEESSARSMPYRIRFLGSNPSIHFELHGEKHLSPRRRFPWRLLDIWPDTTTVDYRLWRVDPASIEEKQLIGTGTLRIGMLSFLRQLLSLHANRQLSLLERGAVLGTFLRKFTAELWQVYGVSPAIDTAPGSRSHNK